jgi:large subunit ribosomal protein L18
MKKKKVFGIAQRPRMAVFRSVKNIFVQVIDDTAQRTLVSASTAEKGQAKSGGNIAAAKAIGKLIAERALSKGIKKVVFDRGRFIYHGRVRALAEAAREGGLQF